MCPPADTGRQFEDGAAEAPGSAAGSAEPPTKTERDRARLIADLAGCAAAAATIARYAPKMVRIGGALFRRVF